MTLFNVQQLKRNSRPEQIPALSRLFFAGKCLPKSSFLDSLFFILLVLQLNANLGENMLSKSFLCFFLLIYAYVVKLFAFHRKVGFSRRGENGGTGENFTEKSREQTNQIYGRVVLSQESNPGDLHGMRMFS